MLKEQIDILIDILAEEYSKIENTFLIRNNQQLVKFMENPDNWKHRQMQHRNGYKKEIILNAKRQIQQLNDKTAKVLLLSYKQVDKDIVDISEKEIVLKKYNAEFQKKIAELQDFNKASLMILANTAFQTYNHQVRLLDATYKGDALIEGIKRQMPKGIQNGMKITYADGKQMNFKSYMEMSARTSINNEITERQMQVGADAGIVFYICDSYADCAKDHADYQGKIYYNADAKLNEAVESYIRANNIMSMQEVSGAPIYLTTRPNCRHNFHAISTDQVLGGKSASKIVEENGFSTGTYKDSNYKALQQQRYNERQIRKWKTNLENQKQVGKETGQPNQLAISKAQHKVSEWQKKQRELIASNDEVLKRDYWRENAKVIVDDLGVKYRYKIVDGELVKKK